MNRRTKFFLLATVVTCLHLAITLFSTVASILYASARYHDNPGLPVSRFEAFLSAISSIAAEPVLGLLNLFGLTPNGAIVEGGVFILNSAIWGFTLAFVLWRLTPRSSGPGCAGPLNFFR